MSQPPGHGYAAIVFADGQAAQQHGEARSTMPKMIAGWAAERWQAGWDASDATDRAGRIYRQSFLDRRIARRLIPLLAATPIIAVARIETRIANLLIDMPEAGEWMLGLGRHSALLTELLDANTTLIEEEETAEDDIDLVPWRVRLSREGVITRARYIAARKIPRF